MVDLVVASWRLSLNFVLIRLPASYCHIVPPWPGPYVVRSSQSLCEQALLGFYFDNEAYCASPSDVIRTSDYTSATTTKTPRLCGAPELPDDPRFRPSACDAAVYCSLLSGYKQCSRLILWDNIGPRRLTMKSPPDAPHAVIVEGSTRHVTCFAPESYTAYLYETNKQRKAVAANEAKMVVFLSPRGKPYIGIASELISPSLDTPEAD